MTKFSQSRRNLGQMLAEHILDKVRQGELVPGQRLPTQRELMEEFDVGANAVREAMQALVVMGLIDVRPGRGAVVIGLPTDSAMGPDTVAALLQDQAVADLIEFRQSMEVEIAERATIRAQPEDIARIREALDAFRTELLEGRSVYQADITFHRTLALATQNAVYVNVLDALGDLLAMARRRTEAVPGTKDKALAEHELIFQAIVDRDPVRARAAMAEHLETVLLATAEIQRRIVPDGGSTTLPADANRSAG